LSRTAVQHLKNITDTVCTTTQIGELLRLSPQHLSGLEKKGVIKRLSQNRWPLLQTVQGYIRSLQESRRYDNSDALRRVREEQLRKLQLANAERDRTMIELTEAEFAVDSIVGIVRTVFGSLPARLSRELRVQQEAEMVVNQCLNEVSAGLVRVSDALRSGADPSAAVALAFRGAR
jgi:hypothetical protein